MEKIREKAQQKNKRPFFFILRGGLAFLGFHGKVDGRRAE